MSAAGICLDTGRAHLQALTCCLKNQESGLWGHKKDRTGNCQS